jgi:hypothetical protein
MREQAPRPGRFLVAIGTSRPGVVRTNEQPKSREVSARPGPTRRTSISGGGSR